jgi:hypothetical protein
LTKDSGDTVSQILEQPDQIDLFSTVSETRSPAKGKMSLFNPTILSNFILSLCLMKNLAMKFTEPENFVQAFNLDLESL